MTGSPASEHVGKYQVLFELGRGGMSTVLLGVHRGPQGFVKLQVIKTLKAELAEDPEFLCMFQEEARLAARINHRNVVQTNEIGFDGNEHFIAMEYLDGQSFETLLRKGDKTGQPLPVALQLRILADALEGLHFAHELRDFDGAPLNPVHRDVSPHNIFVTYEGQVKVVDFGIAKAADGDVQTRTGVLKGKVAYMAPEQIAGVGLDRRTDIFSVGVILWRVLTGVRLWRGLSDMEIIVRVERGEIPSPSTVRADLPLALVAICKKALAGLPAERYQTAAELQAAIEAYLEHSGERPTNRSLATLLCDMFRENREKLAAAIETQLRSSEAGIVPELLAPLPAPASGTPSTTQPVEQPPNAVRRGATRAVPRAVVTPSVTKHAALRGWVVASALLFAIGAGLSYGRWSPLARLRGLVEATPAPNAGPVSDSTPAYVELRFSLTPPDALVYVDDQPLSPPARFVRDGAAHRLRAQAAGLVAQVQLVTFDADIKNVTFKLDPPEVQRHPDPELPLGKHSFGPHRNQHTGHQARQSTQDDSPPAAVGAGAAGSAAPTIDTGDPWRK